MSAPLHAGAGLADITPAMGIQLAGDIGRHRPTEEIRERLYARALVLESGGTRACYLSLDLLAATCEWADEIRRQVSARAGIPFEHVIFNVTQNHAAPTIGHCFCKDSCTLFPPEYPWLRGGDERYNPVAVAGCLAAVDAALANLRPVRLDLGRGMDGRVAFNRRFVMRDGTVRTHPAPCDPNILHTEGPIDPEVGVATFRDDAGIVATLLHHTCHPVFGYPHRFVIADWPGAWAEMMAETLGGAALVVNGCCGNVHHCNHLDPNPDWSTGAHRRAAAKLAETAATVAARLQPSDDTTLACARTVLRLPLRLLTSEVIAAAEAYLAQYPAPKFLDAARTMVDWDWVYAACTLDLHDSEQQDAFCDYEIQAVRIGDLALVALMGEPFVEAQLAIKAASPAPHTMVAHFCNGYAGYIPTQHAFTRGGYETRTSNGSKWQPDALDQITQAAIGLLKGLWA
jgi:hypothetical protein